MTLFIVFVILGFVLKLVSYFTRVPEWTAWASWLIATLLYAFVGVVPV